MLNGDKRAQARGISWLARKVIEAKGGRDQREMVVWGKKINIQCALLIAMALSANSMWTILVLY